MAIGTITKQQRRKKKGGGLGLGNPPKAHGATAREKNAPKARWDVQTRAVPPFCWLLRCWEREPHSAASALQRLPQGKQTARPTDRGAVVVRSWCGVRLHPLHARRGRMRIACACISRAVAKTTHPLLTTHTARRPQREREGEDEARRGDDDAMLRHDEEVERHDEVMMRTSMRS